MRRAQDSLKIKAKFKVEFEVEDGAANPRHTLKRALTRAERGLKEIIEEGIRCCAGSAARISTNLSANADTPATQDSVEYSIYRFANLAAEIGFCVRCGRDGCAMAIGE
jgi:hypothetical protein